MSAKKLLIQVPPRPPGVDYFDHLARSFDAAKRQAIEEGYLAVGERCEPVIEYIEDDSHSVHPIAETEGESHRHKRVV